MSNYRIFVEKYPEFQVEAKSLLAELNENLQLKLRKALDAETVKKMQISTIHSFCIDFLKERNCSINLIDESFVAQADYCGTVSGAKVDKSDVFEYHLGEACTPVIEKSPLVMECEVIDTYQIDNFNNYICSISHTYVNEELLDENGKLDYNLLKPVLFEMPTYKYLRTGEVIGDCVKMGKAWASENKG